MARVDTSVEVTTDMTIVPEPPTILVDATLKKMMDVPVGMVAAVFPPLRVGVTSKTIVEVPAGDTFVNADITILVTVSVEGKTTCLPTS
jgi:hypothetical protein